MVGLNLSAIITITRKANSTNRHTHTSKNTHRYLHTCASVAMVTSIDVSASDELEIVTVT